MKYNDGTRVSDLSDIEIDREKMQWLEEVLSNYVKDFVERMREIRATFQEKENQQISLKEQEALLDELQEIVESLDQAKSEILFFDFFDFLIFLDLHLIGGLSMLMELLQSSHSSLKSKSAEIVACCVQNNLPVQKVSPVLNAIRKFAS